MRDYGIDKGLIEFRDDSARNQRGWKNGFWGFRKMFRDYLTKLNVAFYDTCCPAATTDDIWPMRFNSGTGDVQRFDGTTWVAISENDGEFGAISVDDGLVSDLAIKFGNDGNNGLYGVSDTVLGVAVEGAQVATFTTTGMTTNIISERTTDSGITLSQATIEKHTTFAVPITATVLAANFKKGYFTSTSAAAVSLTTDTAANIATAIGAVAGTVFDFYVDNSGGANTVTVILGAGITVATPVVTGGGTLTVSTANGVGIFRLVFTSATAARAYRIG